MTKTAKNQLIIGLIALVVLGGVSLRKYNSLHRLTAQQYPRIVHNTCAGQWAVETGVSKVMKWQWIKEEYRADTVVNFWGTAKVDQMYILNAPRPGDVAYLLNSCDTSCTAPLGREFTFPDSAAAVTAWKAYQGRQALQQELSRQQHVRDSLRDAAARRTEDSLFKCQHSYK